MVKLFNKLNSIQSVRIKDREGKYYTIFIESKRSVDLEPYQITKDITDKIVQGSLIDLSNYLTADLINTNNSTLVVSNLKIESSEQPKVETKTSDDLVQDPADANINPLTDNEDDINVVNDENEDLNGSQSESGNPEELNNQSNPSVFVCDICGGQYASQRGLDMHKAKSHK